MNKIIFLNLAAIAFSTSGFASTRYHCTGIANKKVSTSIDLSFGSLQSVTVEDHEGGEHTLSLSSENSKYKVYANYEYDGYGGSIELRIPKSFRLSGSGATQEFNVQYQVQTYSELGHVGSEFFKGQCQLSD